MDLGLSQYVPTVIYLCGFVVAFLSIIYRVEVGIFFLAPLIPWQNIWFKMHPFPLGKDMVDILIVSMIIGWIFRIRRKEKLFEKTPLNMAIFFLIIVSIVGLFIGGGGEVIDTNSGHLRTWKNFIIMLLLFFITLNNIRKEKHIRLLIFLIALSMLVNSFYFHSTFMEIRRWNYSERQRVSTFVDLGPNEMASLFVQGSMLLLGLWLTIRERWSRLFIGIVLLVNAYAIIYSFSRAAYLSTIASAVFLGVVKERRIFIVLGALLIFWTAVLPTSVVQRVQMTQNEEGQLESSADERLKLWKFGLKIFPKRPFGVGWHMSRFIGYHRDLHNTYIKILVQLGIQGFLIYILLYFLALKSGWILYKSSDNEFLKGLGLGFVACVISNMVNNFFGQNWFFFSVTSNYWIFFAIVLRGNIIVKNRAEKAIFDQNI